MFVRQYISMDGFSEILKTKTWKSLVPPVLTDPLFLTPGGPEHYRLN